MYKFLLSVAALLCLATSIQAQTYDSLELSIRTTPDRSFILTDPHEVLKHDNELVTIEGCIVSAKLVDRVKGKPIFLDFFVAYPNNMVSAAIWEEDQPNFLPAADYNQKLVRITGRVKIKASTQTGKGPEQRATISLHDPKQITILGDCPPSGSRQ